MPARQAAWARGVDIGPCCFHRAFEHGKWRGDCGMHRSSGCRLLRPRDAQSLRPRSNANDIQLAKVSTLCQLTCAYVPGMCTLRGSCPILFSKHDTLCCHHCAVAGHMRHHRRLSIACAASEPQKCKESRMLCTTRILHDCSSGH